ncbi:MAG: four helix bundle protein [Betaproteobacteria bacterium]
MTEDIRPHYRLEAWKEAMALVRSVYEMSRHFPAEERFGISARIQRSAVSVPSNIAEGAARSGDREFAQYLNIARGSLSELETRLLIAMEIGYVDRNHVVFSSVDRVSRLLTGLHKSVKE